MKEHNITNPEPDSRRRRVGYFRRSLQAADERTNTHVLHALLLLLLIDAHSLPANGPGEIPILSE